MNLLHALKDKYLIMTDDFFLFRPSPERIFECFLEVAAPTDSEGKYCSLNLLQFVCMRKIK